MRSASGAVMHRGFGVGLLWRVGSEVDEGVTCVRSSDHGSNVKLLTGCIWTLVSEICQLSWFRLCGDVFGDIALNSVNSRAMSVQMRSNVGGKRTDVVHTTPHSAGIRTFWPKLSQCGVWLRPNPKLKFGRLRSSPDGGQHCPAFGPNLTDSTKFGPNSSKSSSKSTQVGRLPPRLFNVGQAKVDFDANTHMACQTSFIVSQAADVSAVAFLVLIWG